jgi:hypothetical protein
MIFDQYAQGQTPTLTINYACENGVAMGTITVSGFPEGNTVLTRNDIQPPFLFLATFIVPSSGSFTFPSTGTDVLVQGTFTYTAFSDPNNNGILDPGEVSASNTITVDCSEPPTLPPSQQIQNLINTINEMNLASSIRNSLTAPLNQAVNILENNIPTDDVSVCNKLNAFIQQVNAQTQNNRLTQEQSNQLIQAAQSIRNALNCS